jgi:hypothetical protein
VSPHYRLKLDPAFGCYDSGPTVAVEQDAQADAVAAVPVAAQPKREIRRVQPAAVTHPAKPAQPAVAGSETEQTLQPLPRYADAPVRSVIEAAATGQHPERLTSGAKPKPFDRAAFKADPDACLRTYLETVEPGRIWDVAEAGLGVKQLEAKTDTVVEMKAGQSVRLAVTALPSAPVTFTSFDWGEFQNRLTSVTVKADGNGTAAVTFTATPGTTGHVDILAASPLTSGQVKFYVEIE